MVWLDAQSGKETDMKITDIEWVPESPTLPTTVDMPDELLRPANGDTEQEDIMIHEYLSKRYGSSPSDFHVQRT